RLRVDLLVIDHARENSGHENVKHRADDEAADDADRYVAGWVLRFFGLRTDGVEPKIGENDPCGARHHAEAGAAENGSSEKGDAAITVRRKIRGPVAYVDVEHTDQDDENHDRDFHGHHDAIDHRRLADADDEHDGDQKGDDDRWKIKDISGA